MVKGEKIMVVEILYPELTNIFGDYANITYLEKCMPEAKFIYTTISKFHLIK